MGGPLKRVLQLSIMDPTTGGTNANGPGCGSLVWVPHGGSYNFLFLKFSSIFFFFTSLLLSFGSMVDHKFDSKIVAKVFIPKFVVKFFINLSSNLLQSLFSKFDVKSQKITS